MSDKQTSRQTINDCIELLLEDIKLMPCECPDDANKAATALYMIDQIVRIDEAYDRSNEFKKALVDAVGTPESRGIAPIGNKGTKGGGGGIPIN